MTAPILISTDHDPACECDTCQPAGSLPYHTDPRMAHYVLDSNGSFVCNAASQARAQAIVKLCNATPNADASAKQSATEAITYAIKRLTKAQQYGPDMPASKDLCISDTIQLLQTVRALLNGEL